MTLLLGRAGLMARDTVGAMVISTVTNHVFERPAVNWARRYRSRMG